MHHIVDDKEHWFDESHVTHYLSVFYNNHRFFKNQTLNIYFHTFGINHKKMFYHRLDGPAYTSITQRCWFKRGVFHRLDGPANIYDSIIPNMKDFYICGKNYSEEEYWEMIDLYKTCPIEFKLRYGFDIEKFFDYSYDDIIWTRVG